MKTVILVIGVLVCIIAVHAVTGQHPHEGSIIYEVKVNMHRTLPPERKEMKEMIPEYNSFRDKLVFRGTESLYTPLEDEIEEEFSDEGGGMRMRIRRPMMEYYLNTESGKKIRAQEFMGKKYLILDSLAILPWKLMGGKKIIQGYECKSASYFNEKRKQNVVVWYAETLRPFGGPENYNTLPGTVMQVDINEGERTITAVDVSLKALKKNEIKEPSSGQPINENEFRSLVEEQMKRMNSRDGMIIRTN